MSEVKDFLKAISQNPKAMEMIRAAEEPADIEKAAVLYAEVAEKSGITVSKETIQSLLEGKERIQKENTEKACREFGCIHCVIPVGNAVVAAVCVEEVTGAAWRDLGMPEALWDCRVKEFGPLIVSIDTYGNNYFEEKKVEYNRRKEEQIEKINKEVGFIK